MRTTQHTEQRTRWRVANEGCYVGNSVETWTPHEFGVGYSCGPVVRFVFCKNHMAGGVQEFRYESHKRDGKLVVRAEGVLNTSPTTIIKAHMERRYATAFRDIRRYTMFYCDDDVVHTAYASKVGFLNVPMSVCKRATPNGIEFWTPASSLAAFKGTWSITPHDKGGSKVTLEQTVTMPGWARILPVESYVHERIRRAFEDMAALEI